MTIIKDDLTIHSNDLGYQADEVLEVELVFPSSVTFHNRRQNFVADAETYGKYLKFANYINHTQEYQRL